MADHGADRFDLDATDPPARRLAVVLVCGLVGVLIALAALALAPPRYQASAELALASLAAAAAAEDAAASPEVLAAAVALAPDTRPADGLDLARLRALLGGAAAPQSSAPDGVAAVRGRVAARRSGERVVITVTDDDARDAARLADAVAGAVLARVSQPAAPELAAVPAAAPSRDPGDGSQRDQARAEAEARSAAVRRVDEALLADLGSRLAAARARTAEQRVRLAQVERLGRSGADADAVPEAVQSPAITALREQMAEAAQQERQAAKVLGRRHPSRQVLAEEQQRLDRLLRAELQRLIAAARQELERAEAAERALSGEIETQRAALAAAIEALARLRRLEQGAGAAPPPARSETPAPAAAAPSGRLIAAAVPPARPEGLPPAALLGIGLAAGCGVGAAVAAARRGRH